MSVWKELNWDWKETTAAVLIFGGCLLTAGMCIYEHLNPPIKTLLCMWEGGSMKFEGHVELLPDRKYKVTKEDGSDYTIVVPPLNAPCVISKTVSATATETSTKPPDINT
jgi:hypothetical protein